MFVLKLPLKIDIILLVFVPIIGTGSEFQRSFRVFTSSDPRSFLGLTSKITPLDAMLNLDADVKKTTARHPL